MQVITCMSTRIGARMAYGRAATSRATRTTAKPGAQRVSRRCDVWLRARCRQDGAFYGPSDGLLRPVGEPEQGVRGRSSMPGMTSVSLAHTLAHEQEKTCKSAVL